MHYLAYTKSRILANNPTHFGARGRRLVGHVVVWVRRVVNLKF
jgi:hypothetical protein